MPNRRMHADEVDTDVSLVRRLLGAQFPHWSGLPIEPVPSTGTDNAIYRLGDELAVRLPRIAWAIGQVDLEHEWLPRLAPQLPLAIPEPLVKGEPGEGYPWHWSVYRWLPGGNATIDELADPRQSAIDLARFLVALRRIDTNGGRPAARHNRRSLALATHDARVRDAIRELHGVIDTDSATTAWEAALRAPVWDGEPVWFHGDMLLGNLLFEDGRLSAVIDFSGMCVGDPTCDLTIAWSLFAGESRETFREALDVDDGSWARGRGYALSQALIFIPYYLETNPLGVVRARRVVDEVLADVAP
jgi:aminoglycoside phosphotransferase (APT) family kinase protein